MKEILDFNFLDCGKDEYSNIRHAHGACFEILLVCNGTGNFLVRDKLLPLQKNCLYFINGMETHCSIPQDAKCYERRKIVFSSAFLGRLLDFTESAVLAQSLFLENGGCYYTLSGDALRAVNESFADIEDALTRQQNGAKAVVATALLRMVCAVRTQKEADTKTDERIKNALDYINANLFEPLTLDGICQRAFLSKSYLCHAFKNTVGMRVFDYILSRRLSIAKQLLLTSDKPISEIAMSTGFSTFAYFSKVFKAQEGVTPKQFRAENKIP